jgi:hypothetical protein
LQSAARAIVLSHHGTLADQVGRRLRTSVSVPRSRGRQRATSPASPQPRLDLEFRNGLGGFGQAGS